MIFFINTHTFCTVSYNGLRILVKIELAKGTYLTYVVVARADCGLASSRHDVGAVEVGAVLAGHTATAERY